ncbi:MAG: pro-sigmaK processing inhibitor BofA family protein [Firmicutes bacterium]|nr:pro-sigmaK processing inhibitor BofA family protein [Bacillota bacterium]
MSAWTDWAVAGAVSLVAAAALAAALGGPLRWLGLWLLRSIAGAAALWLLQYPAALAGWHVGVNPWTALVAGALGVPGIVALYTLAALLH